MDKVLIYLTLLLVMVFATCSPVLAETARATFAVHCYDVGNSALDGHAGVIAVEKGWQGFREINRVEYNPQQVGLTQLESWLKQAGTYRATLESSLSGRGEKP